ncbi:nuclear autoantigenic sperm protein [Engystomops pustulosus]|uniref:nuclear autoantigenic sperm protein n=1 Tax=Engystomops pustulosus TaxID=76066 RepID=UPI003AFB7351
MAEQTAAAPAHTEKMEEVSAPSTSAKPVEGVVDDVDAEAKRLMASGTRFMVLKDFRSAVNCFQETCSILGKKYGETADECADALYYYGLTLLEVARMEDNVLGNALEGMPEEDDDDDDECGKEDPNIPSADNLDEKEREELREQVYNAMAEEKSDKENGEDSKEPKAEPEAKDEEMECEKPSEAAESKDEADTNGDGKESNADVKETKANGDGKEADAHEKEAEANAHEQKADANGDGKEVTAEVKEAEANGETKDGETSKEVEAAKEETTAEDAKKEPESSEVAAEEKSTTEATEKTNSEVQEADTTQGPEKSEDEAKAKTEGAEESEAAAKPEETAADKDKTEGDEEMEPMEGDEEEEAESDNEEPEEKENEKEEEDVEGLQLSWEVLELAKVIYKRKQDKESQLKAAQAHLKLGEVSIESENYSQAVEDFLACLTIQKEHLEEHDRLVAETQYQLGLAYQYSSRHEEAITHFTQSIDVIEKRLAVLTEELEKASEESKEETQKEMEELKGLLPDIKEKIEDSKEAKKTAEDKALQDTLVGTSSGFPKENGGTSSTSTSTATAEKSSDCTVPVTNCVSDISHLVRKKRKPEEESPQKEAKKPKSEPVENGAGNGDAVVPTSEQVEKTEEENQTPMETAAVESTA